MMLVLVISTVSLFGCGGDSSSDPFAAATANDLTNRSFTFTKGASATLAAVFGLAANQAFTLQFASFGGARVGPVTLTAGGSLASGTVTLSPCIFRFDRSTFPAGQGPRTGTPLAIDPCDINRNDTTFRLTAVNSETALSAAAIPLPNTHVALVLTSDGQTGSYAVVDLSTRLVFRDLRRGGVQPDALARFFNGRVYVVNRSGNESMQVLDPQLGFITPPGGELSLGNDVTPQDIVFLSATKAYVSRLASSRLLIVNPTTLARLGEINLSQLVQANDPDGSPEPAAMLLNNGLVYVALQNLDRTQASHPAVARGAVAVLDPTTDSLVTVIALHGANPTSEVQFTPSLNRILLSTIGTVGSADGGIEAINPELRTVDASLVLSEAVMGGDITAFAIVTRSKGFAVVREAQTTYSLVTFDPSTGQRLARLTVPTTGLAAHVAINSNQEVYFSVVDVGTATPGVRIFDAVTNQEITTSPLNVGLLPPLWTLFLE
jgi:hypothetical protein